MEALDIGIKYLSIIPPIVSIFIVYQIISYKKNYRAGTLNNLYRSFYSEKLTNFREEVSKIAGGNPFDREDFIECILNDENCNEKLNTRKQAFLYGSFFKYIYYSIKKGLIKQDDVIEIWSVWIKEYVDLRKDIEKTEIYNKDREKNKKRLDLYFPKPPDKILGKLKIE